MGEFQGKVVLITGASSGLGAETARLFAKEKASLSLTGRNEENLAKVAEECKALGAEEVLQIIAHFDSREGIEKTINETMKKYNKLNVLVNNAGIVYSTTINTATPEIFDDTFNINVKAPLFLTQLAMPFLEKTKGNVVNISSCSSQMCTEPELMVYCMSKAAVDQFTKTLAIEMAKKEVRVNAVNPADVPTKIFRKVLKTEDDYEKFYDTTGPMHLLHERNVTAREVADAVLFLASDRATMITGTRLNVDGGRVIAGQ
ncbi:3-oxoacyl-[acyl-carrier-protein] reductase FabG-like [Clavelina lepadiformis]|uniref:3-oxoacyl-[acyl-carrier-protein] reductase FabG-like n=1 Tax=Clavelina lepadiformis TaxID=159417 RepID=UPI0040413FD7